MGEGSNIIPLLGAAAPIRRGAGAEKGTGCSVGTRGGGPCSIKRGVGPSSTWPRVKSRERGRRVGEGGRGRGGERSCSEDSSEAWGPTEDGDEGRHSSEARGLREAQRKMRGQRAARKAEERLEECSGAAEGDTRVHYTGEHITYVNTREVRGPAEAYNTRRQEEKSKK